jgi:hypothetical protein
MNGIASLAAALSKRATGSGLFATAHTNGSGALLKDASSSGIFDHYKFTHPSLTTSHKHNTKHLSYKYPNLLFFQMISDLNFDPSDEENYTAEEPSGSSFFAIIFSNYAQNNFYPNQVQNIISNFNQGGYYTNYPYDSSIYSYMYPYVTNNRTQQCHHIIPIIFLEIVAVLMIN